MSCVALNFLVCLCSVDKNQGPEHGRLSSRNCPPQSVEHWISRSEKAKDLTAHPHPRYPYLQWTMPSNKTVAVVIMEKLEPKRLSSALELETERELTSFLVRCWNDIQSVMEVLWEFKGGHVVHDDSLGKHVYIAKREGVDRCLVIDFGIVFSADDWNGRIHQPKVAPFYWMKLRTLEQRKEYVEKYGIAEYRKRGWEMKMIGRGQIFIKLFLEFLHREEEWSVREEDQCGRGIGWRADADCSEEQVQEGFVNKWCGIRHDDSALVQRLDEQRADGILTSQAFLDLVKSHTERVENDMIEADLICKHIL